MRTRAKAGQPGVRDRYAVARLWRIGACRVGDVGTPVATEPYQADPALDEQNTAMIEQHVTEASPTEGVEREPTVEAHAQRIASQYDVARGRLVGCHAHSRLLSGNTGN